MHSDSTYFYWEKDHLHLRLYVGPNAKQDEAVGVVDGVFKIKISAPAQENKANAYLCNLLSQWFGVPKSRVKLLKGQSSRYKEVAIISPKKFPNWQGLDKNDT